jgi:hypothetical protein
MEKKFGFRVEREYNCYGDDLEYICTNISKHGIHRGYVTDTDGTYPVLSKIYYYAIMEGAVIEDSDSCFCIKYKKLDDKVIEKLKEIRAKCIEEYGESCTSSLRFFEHVGTKEPLETKNGKVCGWYTDYYDE